MKQQWRKIAAFLICAAFVTVSAGCGKKAVTESDAGNVSNIAADGSEIFLEEQESGIAVPSSDIGQISESSHSSASSSVTSSTAHSDDEPPLPTDKTPWTQKQFILSTFRAVERDGYEDEYEKAIKAHKEAGFNLVENAILAPADLYRVLDVCERVGMRSLAQDISAFSGMGEHYPLNNEDMLLDTIRQLNRYKMLEGYFVWDEPTEDKFAKHKTVNDFFKKTDPARLAFSLIFPSYGAYTWSANHANWTNDSYKRYADKYLSTVNPDVVCVDYYPFRDSTAPINESYLWRDLGYLRKRAKELNKPLWFYFQASAMGSGLEQLSAAMLKVQMYSALAYGVTGLSYYMSLDVVTDAQGEKTPKFEEIKGINKEVLNLGNFLFKKTADKLYHTGVSADKLPGYFTDNPASDSLIQSLPDGAVAAVFTDGTAAKTVVVVNKSFSQAMSGQLALKGVKNIKAYNKTNNATIQMASSAQISLDIPAGDCAVYVIQ